MESSTAIKENEYIFSAIQVGNEPAMLTPLQSFLEPYVDRIEIVLWVIWVAVFLYVIKRLLSIPANSSS